MMNPGPRYHRRAIFCVCDVSMQIRSFFLAMLIAVPAGSAWSARPFVTDDARLTTAGSCQLETWTRMYRDSTEFWALPACNPGGNLELTAGGGQAVFELNA